MSAYKSSFFNIFYMSASGKMKL